MVIALLVFLPMLCGPVLWAVGRADGRTRDELAAVLTGLELLLSLSLFLSGAAGVWGLSDGAEDAALAAYTAATGAPSLTIPGVLLGGLSFVTDGFRSTYSVITSLLWFATTLFAREYFRKEREGLNPYWMFLLITLGATQGVMLSADFMTTFVFFEILSLTSFTWVIHEQTREAVRAAYTYLFIAVGGGLVLFMGLALLNHACGTLNYAALRELLASGDLPMDGEPTAFGLFPSRKLLLPAGICILLGFGAKAGMFPLHVWLPMAHPVAPSPASALLSGVLTKVGVFGVLMTALEALYDSAVFGLTVLVLGLITMVLGAALAVFSVNLKRTLACSSMSQIGFILTGIACLVLARSCQTAASALGPSGEAAAETANEAAELAISGAVLHMANHSVLKLVLFMAAGVVLMNLHALNLNDIRGWGRNKTALKIAFALGGLGISGVPLLNGYLSKTMLHEGIVHLTKSVSLLELGHTVSSTAVLHHGGVIGDAGTLVRLEVSLPAWLHAAEWVFLFSGGLTFAYMLKLFICVFCEENADPKRQARFDRSSRCMDRLSTAAVLGSALLLIPMGQPFVMTKLAARMTGETFHFAAFSLENLKGGAISLLIGGAVYLLFIRGTLLRDNRYVNLWPAGLDLEGRVYRPLFTELLPRYCGNLLGLLAENKLTRPLFHVVLFLLAFVTRILCDSLDASLAFLRRTVLREASLFDGTKPPRVGRVRMFRRATGEALFPLFENFSFALLMTCMGIIVFLAALAAALL